MKFDAYAALAKLRAQSLLPGVVSLYAWRRSGTLSTIWQTQLITTMKS